MTIVTRIRRIRIIELEMDNERYPGNKLSLPSVAVWYPQWWENLNKNTVWPGRCTRRTKAISMEFFLRCYGSISYQWPVVAFL